MVREKRECAKSFPSTLPENGVCPRCVERDTLVGTNGLLVRNDHRKVFGEPVMLDSFVCLFVCFSGREWFEAREIVLRGSIGMF